MTPCTLSAALCSHASLYRNLTETLVLHAILPAVVYRHFQLLLVHAAHNMVSCRVMRAVNPDSPAHAADDGMVCRVYAGRTK